ncbi:MAG: hypothetical protein BroJett011_48620 [Chloroflexota bacterium]|nr:MAG: hypothetical protein BroJett011_48620 [Chloroflexota bacterium]
MDDGISIPSDWSPYISYSFNRIYISQASGCSANCVYCFIFDDGHPRKPRLFDIPGDDVRQWLESQKGFRAGRNGTLISLSPYCDPFSKEVTDKTLEFVEALAPLQNPIQLSTKYFVDQTIAKRLGKSQTMFGQIILYATVTSFQFWKRIELAADEPYLRIEGLLNARRQGINTCLAIKPVLPGITDKEIDLFVKAIRDYDVPYCVVGVMYSSEKIETRIRRRKLSNDEFELRIEIKGDRPPPCNTNRQQQNSLNIDTLDIVYQMIPQLEATGAQCVISGPCVVALSYDVLCPTGVWRYLPHLCVSCQANCRSKFAEVPIHMKTLFPDEVEGLKAV